jgi:hypothetical protein
MFLMEALAIAFRHFHGIVTPYEIAITRGNEMKNTIFDLSLVFALSLHCGCLAADETAKPTNDLGKDASNAVKTLGKESDKAEQAIRSSVKSLGNDDKKGGKTSKTTSNWQKDASNAMNTVGKEADKAEHSITSAVQGIGKNSNNTVKNEKTKNLSGGSFNESMNEFGKNANKAGAAMENSMRNIGKQAGEQIGKAEHASGADNKNKAGKGSKPSNDLQKK